MTTSRVAITLLVLSLVSSVPAGAEDQPPADQPSASGSPEVGRTPLRLSFLDGEVSFWRPGAADWAPARINTPLAPGDALYAGSAANLELQVGPRAFVRAGEETQLGLENQEPDFVQLKVTAGHVSLDVRALSAGHTFELDTPSAAFTIEITGYYRVDVSETTTTFVTRRGGRATMTPPGGASVAIAPSEQVVVQGAETPVVETYVAPELDAWDRWNYERTDDLIDAVSTRYVSSGVYGTDSLDHYGNWRVVSDYGPVWVPDGVGAGWAPYSAGRWIWDPYYGWTWLDDAAWGWAPYHYGRWVYVNSCWAWAPGPVVVRPVYAPALVAFFGGGGFGVRVGFGTPVVGWCALGWGEPLVPWWGRPGFVGRPWWGGWGGPHVVNNVVINKTTVVNVNDVNVYQNVHFPHSVTAVDRNRFGQDVLQQARLTDVDPHHLDPIHGELPVKPGPASFVPAAGHAAQPPETLLRTSVVATRAPHDTFASLRAEGVRTEHAIAPPSPRLVAPPQQQHSVLSARPPFGQQSSVERPRPPQAPRFEGTWHGEPQSSPAGRVGGGQGNAAPPHYVLGPSAPAPHAEVPRTGSERAAPPPPEAGRREPPSAMQAPRAPARELPGEPANRVFPGHVEAQPHYSAPPAPAAPGVRAPHTGHMGRGSSAESSRGASQGGGGHGH